MTPKFKTPTEMKKIMDSMSAKTFVFTNGCFDLIHSGHITYLYEAKSLGDYLIVALNSDSSVKKIKGSRRPIMSQEERVKIISALEMVDFVLLFEEETPLNLISFLKPQVYVKGGDYSVEDLPEYPFVVSYGGKVKVLSFVEGKSTTNIINAIVERYCK